VKLFVSNLQSEELQRMVRIRGPKTLTEATLYARAEARKYHQYVTSYGTSLKQPTRSQQQQQQRRDSKQSYNKSNRSEGQREPIECFNCGKKGHIAADCWSKPRQSNNRDNSNNRNNNREANEQAKCSNCGKKGHIATECWSKQRSSSNNNKDNEGSERMK